MANRFIEFAKMFRLTSFKNTSGLLLLASQQIPSYLESIVNYKLQLLLETITVNIFELLWQY